jgi:pyruvate,water dikinase
VPDTAQTEQESAELSTLTPIFSGGQTASGGICCGSAFILERFDQLEQVPEGAILITETTPPSLVTILPRLAGVVANLGSSADHFASVAREFQVPLLVGTGWRPQGLANGEDLTLCAQRRLVLRGKLANCEQRVKKQPPRTSPLFHCLHMVIKFTSPLVLVNPAAREFAPEYCRSLHDIIRFCHEKAVQGMFFQSTDSLLRKPKGLRLVSDIPLQMFIIDVGGGLQSSAPRDGGKVHLDELACRPLQTLWRGLSHAGINWQERSAFDWKSYDAVALAGGVSTKHDEALSSFALISGQYLNVNIRFGYHFSLLDCFCSANSEENYILLRFAGGGGSERGKDLRLELLTQILNRLNFNCERTGELLDARLMKYGMQDTMARLELVGRLLGASRQLDMVLRAEEDITWMAEDFFRGRYNFFKE